MKNRKEKVILLVACILSMILVAAAVFAIFRKDKPTVVTRKLTDIEWYDENGKEFVISTAQELYDLVTLSEFYDFKGQTIKLGADIVFNEGNAMEWQEDAPANKWNPIKKFAGTFDGQGHTISGIYLVKHDMKVGFFGELLKDSVVRDFKLINSYCESSGRLGTGSIAGISSGTTIQRVYSDAIIVAHGRNNAGFIGRILNDTKFEECWFDGNIHGFSYLNSGMVAMVEKGEAIISNSLCTATIKATRSSAPGVSGLVAGVSANAKLTLKDCLYAGMVETEQTQEVASVLVSCPANATLEMKNVITTDNKQASVYSIAIGAYTSGGVYQMEKEELFGSKAYEWTELDFEKYWATVADGTPIPKCFAETVPSLEGVQKAYNLDWYDENAKEYVLNSKEDYYGFYILSQLTNFNGKTVKLGTDLQFNKGAASGWEKKAPSNRMHSASNACYPFAGTFDGQGHAISGLYIKEHAYVGMFSSTTGDATVKNLNLKNSYFESTCMNERGAFIGSVSGYGGGTFDTIYSDAIVVGKDGGIGGIFGQVRLEDYAESFFMNCWFDGMVKLDNGWLAGGIVADMRKGDVTISHCLNSGEIVRTGDRSTVRCGGIIGNHLSSSKLVIEDCLNVGKITSSKFDFAASVLGYTSSEGKIVIKDTFTTTESYIHPTWGVSIGVFDYGNVVEGGAFHIHEQNLIGKGGYEWTTLDFDKYWTIVADGTPILKTWANKTLSVSGLQKAYDTSWYNKDAKTYVLKNSKQFIGFGLLGKVTNFEGKTIKLGADITLNSGSAKDWSEMPPSINWEPLGDECYGYFSGTFEGNGHTISGMYASRLRRVGIFGVTSKDAVVKNVNIKNSYFESTSDDEKGSFVGTVAGYGGGTFKTIYSDAIVVGMDGCIGGIFGQVRLDDFAPSSFSNCWFDGSVQLKNGWLAGGIVADTRKGDLTISHCLNSGEIVRTGTRNAVRCGGIIGNHMSENKLVIKDCLNVGKVISNKYDFASSVLGYTSKTGSVEIKDSFTTSESYVHPVWGVSVGVVDYGNIVKGGALIIDEANLIGNGGYEWTSLDFDKYWTIVADGTPMLKTWAGNGLSVSGLQKAYDTSWYNEKNKTYVIKNAKELIGFYLLGKVTDYAGKTIKLGADITLNSGNAAEWGEMPPNIKWSPVGDECYGSFAGTFDGQGHTLSGIYAKRLRRIGIFGVTSKDAVVKNVNVKNSYFESTSVDEKGSFIGTIAGYGGGTFDTIYSDAIVVGQDGCIGGIFGQVRLDDYAPSSFSNCWFNGSVQLKNGWLAGGIVADTRKGDLTISHCLNSGEIVRTGNRNAVRCGGIIGNHMSENKLIIEDCLNVGKVTSNKYDFASSVLGYTSKTGSVEIKDSFTTSESYVHPVWGVSVGVVDYGNIVKGGALIIDEANLIGNGGYEWTTLDFNKYWTIVADDTPMLKTWANKKESVFGLQKAYDTSWYKEQRNTYVLKNVKELIGFYLLGKVTDYAGKTIKLGADITLNSGNAAEWDETPPNIKWTPLGDECYGAFAGTFDGQGHTLSGIYAKRERKVGLFGLGDEKMVVKNLKITNSYFEATGQGDQGAIVGSVAGSIKGGTFSKIKSDAIVVSLGLGAGGIVGYVRNDKEPEKGSIFDNCWYAGQLQSKGSAWMVGGILGDMRAGNVTIQHCLVSGSIENSSSRVAPRLGGIIGNVMSSTTSTLKVLDSLNIATMTPGKASSNFASVLGYTGSAKAVVIEDTFASSESYGMSVVDDNGLVQGTAYDVAKASLIGDGGYECTSLDFKTNWTTVKDDTPMLQAFADKIESVTELKKSYDFSWMNEAKGTQEDPYKLADAADLYGLSRLAKSNDFAGKYFLLTANITINEGSADEWKNSAPKYGWTPIGSYDGGSGVAFAGKVNGDGHTISGLYCEVPTVRNKGVGLFGATGEGFELSDLRLTNSYFKQSTAANPLVGSIVGYGEGTFTRIYSDAIMDTMSSYSGGLIGGIAGNSDIQECWYTGTLNILSDITGVGGIVGRADAQTTITNALNTGTINGSTYGACVGGIIGMNSAGLQIVDSLNAGEVNVRALATNGTVIGDVQGTLTLNNVFSIGKTSGNVYGRIFGQGSLTNGAVQGIITTDITGYKGKENLPFSEFDKYWVLSSASPLLKSLATSGLLYTADTEFEVDHDGYYLINSPEELYGFAKLVNEGNATYMSANVRLKKDIKVNEGTAEKWNEQEPKYSWIPIGSYGNGSGVRFTGKFDGAGHSIIGVYCEVPAIRNQGVGLFGSTGAGAEISNLRLTNSYFKQSTEANPLVGSIMGYGEGTFTRIYSDAIVDTMSAYSGGLIGGIAGNSDIHECWYAGTLNILSNITGVGGIVGRADAQLTIADALNTGTINGSTNGACVGGIIGMNSAGLQIVNSLNAGDVNVRALATNGKVIGDVEGALTLNNAFSTGETSGNVYGRIYGKGSLVSGAVQGIITNDITGYNAWNELGFDFSNAWMIRKDKIPALKYFLTEAEWLCKEGYYPIATADELYAFATAINNKRIASNTNVKLVAPITINEGSPDGGTPTDKTDDWSNASVVTALDLRKWTPIGSYGNGAGVRYTGKFDGAGYSISGLYCEVVAVRNQGVGLFGSTGAGAEISNLRLTNSYFKQSTAANSLVGSIVGYGEGTFTRIYSDAIMDTQSSYAGGLIGGIAATSSLEECWYDGTLTVLNASTGIGGIIGRADGANTITNCLNTGTIKGSTCTYVGGIVGMQAAAIEICNSLNTGNINATANTLLNGKVVGDITKTLTLTNVYTTGATGDSLKFYGRISGSGSVKDGSVYGVLNESITNVNATTLLSGFDFKDVWAMDGNQPVLKELHTTQ